MNWERITKHWDTVSGEVLAHWSKLTSNDLEWIAGERARLLSTIQAHYGITRELAERDVLIWSASQSRRAGLNAIWARRAVHKSIAAATKQRFPDLGNISVADW